MTEFLALAGDAGAVRIALRTFDGAQKHQPMALGVWREYAQSGMAWVGIAELTPPCVASAEYIAVGDIELHNAEILRRQLGLAEAASPLAVAVNWIESRGINAVRDLIGRFGFVLWHKHTNAVHVIRDALGTRPFYWRTAGSVLCVATRAAVLSRDESFDKEYVAEFLLSGCNPDSRTIYSDVSSVPPGAIISRSASGTITQKRHWSPYEFLPAKRLDPHEASEKLRCLLIDAVRSTLPVKGGVWAHLSGGLDSSTIVSVASTYLLNSDGSAPIDGTITFTDTLGHSNELAYSDAVVNQTGIRNEQLPYGWILEDDDEGPPWTDTPSSLSASFARDRRVIRTLHDADGDTLLIGEGPDLYLAGEASYLADWIVSGHLRSAIYEAMRWAVVRRGSIWSTLWKYGIAPSLPSVLRRGASYHQPPSWLNASFRKDFAIDTRIRPVRRFNGRLGRRFAHAIAHDVNFGAELIAPSMIDSACRVRYPYFYRPLVEFCLQLPPTLRVQPNALKWILRQAMRGVLPENVRTRTGKGAIGTRIVWAINHERARIRALLERSTLIELGCVDRERLRRALRYARRGEIVQLIPLAALISLETWFAARSGQWTARAMCSPLQDVG